MILTNERSNMISAYLTADIERARALLDLSPEEVTSKINACGYDFSVEEIREFGDQLKAAVVQLENGELSENALDDVAGGLVVTGSAILSAAVAMFLGGATLGVAITKTWGW